MDPWIHGSAAGATARAAAGAGAGATASAATVCTYYIIIVRLLCAALYVHDKIHTAAAAAAALAAAPATDPWIHGSIFFIMKHIFHYEMKNIVFTRLNIFRGITPLRPPKYIYRQIYLIY